jgi:hypothetical protein
MRISYNNFVDAVSSGSIVASSDMPNFEVINLQNQRLAVKWGTDSASSQTVVVTFPTASAYSITTAAILGHNIVSGTTVYIQAHTSNSWGSPSFSTALTVIENGAILKFITAQEYQYWRFLINQGDLEIGRVWLGDHIDISPSSLLDFTVEKKRNDTVTYTPYRQKFASEGIGWRKIVLNYPPTNTSTLSLINTMFDTAGNHTSIIFCNFDTVRDFELVEPLYCSINGDVSFKHTKNQKYSYTLELEEDL